jgi:hypothetical protein
MSSSVSSALRSVPRCLPRDGRGTCLFSASKLCTDKGGQSVKRVVWH